MAELLGNTLKQKSVVHQCVSSKRIKPAFIYTKNSLFFKCHKSGISWLWPCNMCKISENAKMWEYKIRVLLYSHKTHNVNDTIKVCNNKLWHETTGSPP